jgi:GGDEF domain-containing protein
VRIAGYVADEAFRERLARAASELFAELTVSVPAPAGSASADPSFMDLLRTRPDIAVVEPRPRLMELLRAEAGTSELRVLAVCRDTGEARRARAGGADDWVLLSTGAEELTERLRSLGCIQPVRSGGAAQHDAADHLRYEELLYDRFTGFPTLPVMIERGREMLERRGRITLLYIEFLRYSKLEEIYGWEKLDEVLQATANAVRDFYGRIETEGAMMVSHTGDDDFIFFADLPE